jgi:hypothetical protein
VTLCVMLKVWCVASAAMNTDRPPR